jgi:hypothetical protein
MRHLLLTFGLCLALGGTARAEPPRPSPSPFGARKGDGPFDFQQAREVKRAGKAITGIGIALHALSLPLIGIASMSLLADHPPAPGENPNPFTISGAVLTAASAIAVGTGVGLWGAGAKAEKAERNDHAFALRF